MRIVIIGAGEVGYHIARVLCNDNDIIVIESDAEKCTIMDELDVQTTIGNGADVKLLTEILPGTDLVVAVTGIDEVNIVACMASKLITKKGANVATTIARVSNPTYIDEPVAQRKNIGIDEMICPELTLALEIAEIVSVPSAMDVVKFSNGKLEMVEFKINDDNPFRNKSLADCSIPASAVVTALFRKGDVIIPKGDDVIFLNDRLVILGKPDAMDEIKKAFDETEGDTNKVAIIGGGTVGVYLANMLVKQGFDIKLVETDAARCESIAEMIPKILVLNGDGMDTALLNDENIGEMDTVVSVTQSDEKNLLSALLAKQLGVKKVIARVDKPEYVNLFELVGIDVAVSSRQTTANEVLKTTFGEKVGYITSLEGEKAKIVELTVNKKSKITKKPISKIKFPRDAIISAIVRDDEVIIPGGTDQIVEGDQVIVFALPSAISDVENLF